MYLVWQPFRKLLIYVVLATGIVTNVISADKTESSGFSEVITQMAIARSQLIAFDVEISGSIKRPVALGGRSAESFEMRIAFEVPESRLLVARRNVIARDDKEVTNSDQRTWSVFVDTPEWQLFRAGAKDGAIWERGHHRGPRPDFFDPRGLGLSFCSELRHGVVAEQVLGNYLQWPDTFARTNLDGGKICFDDTAQDYRIIVDVERGYWPIKMVLLKPNNKREIEVMTETELVQIDGTWVPGTAKVQCSSEEWDLSFRWISINRPLPGTLFDLEKIASSYEFRIVEQRNRPNHGRKLPIK